VGWKGFEPLALTSFVHHHFQTSVMVEDYLPPAGIRITVINVAIKPAKLPPRTLKNSLAIAQPLSPILSGPRPLSLGGDRLRVNLDGTCRVRKAEFPSAWSRQTLQV
jgi:uncharacterized protein YwlG (UPF0340 family)